MAYNNVKRGARKHLDYRSGWSAEEPIIIDDVDEANHGRATARSSVALRDQLEELRRMNRLAGGAAPPSSARGKRTRQPTPEEDEDTDENNTRHFKRARHEQVAVHAITQRQDTTNATEHKQNLAQNLFTMWQDVDRERDGAKALRESQEQERRQVERDEILETQSRNKHERSRMASTLKLMQEDCDRRRQASRELQKAKKQEQMEEERKQRLDAEAEKAKERSDIANNLKAMWEIYDADDRRNRRMGAGQLSERGKKRVQERREAEARAAARRG